MLVAIAVNAQTDFAGGYNCTADAAVLVGTTGSSFGLNTDAEPHYVFWSDRALNNPAAATWEVQSSLACYVSVSLDLGPVVGSNKHIFEVRVYDANGTELGMVKEAGENTDSEKVKPLDGTILIPGAGTYKVELVNNRDWGKGAVKNVILTYAGSAPVTDFAAPGYSCTADDAVLEGTTGSSFGLNTDADPHYIFWSDRALSNPAAATWSVMATRGCYVSVTLDLGPVVGSNKHIFEVSVKNAKGVELGVVKEAGENTDANMLKVLDGTILLPAAGSYTVELNNNRDWGKGSIKNVVLTYAADAPTEIIEVTSVIINKTELALDIEEVEQLSAVVSPEDATDPTVKWESSEPAVATVSEDGFVTAISAGTAIISAKAGEQTANCPVTVAAAAIPDVDFSEPYVLAGKVAHLEGAIWKMYTSETYKLYGDGGHNKNYGNALWTINVTKPCVVTGMLNGVEGGHLFELDLYKGEEFVATIAHPEGKAWSKGEIALEGTLTFATAGNYTLKLRNTQEWSSGKVAGITLTYEADVPAEPLTLYLKLSDDWAGYPARYAIYTWKEGVGDLWAPMDAVEGETNMYTASIPSDNDHLVFVRLNGETTGYDWTDDRWSQTTDLDLPEEGKNLFVVMAGGTGNECTGIWGAYPSRLEDGYYLVGKFGGVDAWDYASLTAEKKFEWNKTVGEGNEEWKVMADLAEGDKVKVCYVYYDAIIEYFPAGEGNEYVVDANHAGAGKTIYFQQKYNEDWGGQFYIEANGEPTAIKNTNAAVKAVKRIENGQMIIIKNGVKFNAIGTVVK